MTKKKMVCRTCDSTEVVRDAWAEWDQEAQEWVLQNVFDDAYCLGHDGQCSIEEEEIETPET